QLAKWADAEIVIFIGCGERGNEMTDVLMEFPELKDPRSGEPLMKRTVLVANTSNMPVAAREASIYTGITIAEYYRDMGYSVALMADSTSRWAEALREMSGRLEEMPGEEGYPAYLPARAAQFYERAGRVRTLGTDDRIGALSAVGAVSPPGGDLSDPVVQATLKVVKVFWSLEDWLAYERHFPAINWLTSYSLYHDSLEAYFRSEVSEEWQGMRQDTMKILQQEAELKEIARLVGVDALSNKDKLILGTAKAIREDFLHQNAFDDVDTYTSFPKQHKMLGNIMAMNRHASDAVEQGVPSEAIFGLPVQEEIARARYIPEAETDELDAIAGRIETQIRGLVEERADVSDPAQ
ncbi:MAG: V-type ATP synthase subunit A, partial [Candidatus Eisenbacteria bacterium]|nr:V-type ATP synthase subunit A [Candidatus Eisenbacteria bacterium]